MCVRILANKATINVKFIADRDKFTKNVNVASKYNNNNNNT